MGFLKKDEKCLFDTQACWSYADRQMLCLDTSSWRTQRPDMDLTSCNRCGICYIFCPTQCITEDGKRYSVNFTFCKGCGVCAKECPKKAIQMVPEGEYADECTSR